MARNECFCFNKGTRGHGNEFGFGTQYVEFFASEEELCSMQFVTAGNFLNRCILNIIISRTGFGIPCSYKCSVLCTFCQFLFRKI